MIDFKNMPETVMSEFKGGKGELIAKMFFDGVNRIFEGRLTPGSSIGLHRHEGTSEMMFFLSGSGKAVLNGVEELLGAGDCHYCPEGSEHTLMNIGETDLVFYAVVPKA